ncbi:phage tail assembly protein [Chromobacterium subtsugae]|uniref:phage tail assembly protein n=1 Tax=Chromobacterium subtsugae TaxID=251747 RepID=UPI000640D367|nr:phage tail assembly protein [Chromobacterium subtsugae]
MSETIQPQPAGSLIESITVELLAPLTLGNGSRVSQLTLRRPKVKDVKLAARFGERQEEQEIGLAALLSGLAAEDIENLDLGDWRKVQESFRRMLGDNG